MAGSSHVDYANTSSDRSQDDINLLAYNFKVSRCKIVDPTRPSKARGDKSSLRSGPQGCVADLGCRVSLLDGLDCVFGLRSLFWACIPLIFELDSGFDSSWYQDNMNRQKLMTGE